MSNQPIAACPAFHRSQSQCFLTLLLNIKESRSSNKVQVCLYLVCASVIKYGTVCPAHRSQSPRPSLCEVPVPHFPPSPFSLQGSRAQRCLTLGPYEAHDSNQWLASHMPRARRSSTLGPCEARNSNQSLNTLRTRRTSALFLGPSSHRSPDSGAAVPMTLLGTVLSTMLGGRKSRCVFGPYIWGPV